MYMIQCKNTYTVIIIPDLDHSLKHHMQTHECRKAQCTVKVVYLIWAPYWHHTWIDALISLTCIPEMHVSAADDIMITLSTDLL